MPEVKIIKMDIIVFLEMDFLLHYFQVSAKIFQVMANNQDILQIKLNFNK